jgi:DNA-binding SARP family transcriptional activator/tetratricopeptide (TPR) repeat protein
MFSVAVLGPLVVRSQGATVPVPAPKQRVILAALALRAGQVLSYDELAEIVWDGAPPDAARVVTRNYVRRLRQVLGPEAGRRIVTRDPGYTLDAAPGEVDALRFTALCTRAGEAVRQVNEATCDQAAGASGTWDMLGEALDLWRGDPLADVPSHMLATAEIPRLDALRAQAFEWRMDAGLAQGRHAELVTGLAQLALEHPLRERFHAQLVLALYRCGRQAEALAAYQRIRRILVDELGVEPGRELQDLQRGILAGDPRLAAPGPALTSLAAVGVVRVGAAPADATPAGVTPAGVTPAGVVPDGAVADGAGAGGAAPDAAVAGGAVADGADPGDATLGVVVPRQLPAEVAHFTGRTAELDTLRTWLQEASAAAESAKVLVIGGTAGAGKTALAVHWAHQAAGSFPDGQLYVNLRGFAPSFSPPTSPPPLRWFLGALGVTEERIPDSLDARAAMYRSLVAGQRVLVILDNARDAAQVRPLLPGSPSCLTVVTSRARLPGLAAIEGARLVPLDVLTATDARDLLASRLGVRARTETQATWQLTELCSRLPLALSIVAARAAARPPLSLAELARELADVRGRLDALDAGDPAASVRAVFSWSCQQLSGSAARMFRLLGLHAGPDISVPAAASLAGLAPCRARTLIAELADAHLIAEHAPGRYAFHDLLRAYAADLSAAADSDDERRDALHRVLDHYLHTAHPGSRLLNPARLHVALQPPRPGVTLECIASPSEALAWFDAEREVLLAAISQASDTGFDAHAWQLPWTLMLFFDRQGHWHDQITIQRIAIAAAKRLGDLAAQARAYRDLGTAFGRHGAFAEADPHYRQALDLHRQIGDRLGEARVHNEMAFVAEQQGRLREALDHAEQSLALHEAGGNQVGVARALNAVGWLHAQLGEYKESLRYCVRALGLSSGCGDPLNDASTWDSMGYAHSQLGQHAEAVSCYRTAVGILDGLHAGWHQAPMLIHLGDAYQAVGEPDAGRNAWRRALVLLEDLKHPDAEQARGRLSGYVPVSA